MAQFSTHTHQSQSWIETGLHGKSLLTLPQLNKGTAFTREERTAFGLDGKLPYRVETIEEQAARCYAQYSRFATDIEKNIYLKSLHMTNETLFYRLVSQHLDEMIPIVYTPTVGEAVQNYSQEYRRERGLYIAYPERERIAQLLQNRTNPDVDIIVATDAEGVLGIGDQGIGGMDIPVAKLMVYTLCGGLNPWRTLPIFLDTGTNNEKLLNDPFYLGWRHQRICGSEYDAFIEQFVKAVQKQFPGSFLHWEDFGRDNARRILEQYQTDLCTFNDDMQGTGAVTVSALLAACRASGRDFTDQRIVIFGAGTAGAGIADQICAAMCKLGLSEQQARSCFWFIDRPGLLLRDMDSLMAFQVPYARDGAEVANWFRLADGRIDLHEVIRQVRPTTLIGCSTRAGAFSPSVLSGMAASVQYPIIFPLSNPTSLAEATPEAILEATNGRALIATGSPFGTVRYDGVSRVIAQCNNALVFPGIGLGVVAIGAQQLTDNMLWAACHALSDTSPALQDTTAPLLPPLGDALQVSLQVAVAVAQQAIDDGVAQAPKGNNIQSCIEAVRWRPQYLPYRYRADK
jgi:malate dehydrogenase (oxaloacetate-decarboxylating)